MYQQFYFFQSQLLKHLQSLHLNIQTTFPFHSDERLTHKPVDLINSKQPWGVHGRKHFSKFPWDKNPALRSDNLSYKKSWFPSEKPSLLYPSISLSGATVFVIRLVSIFSVESNGNCTIIPWIFESLFNNSICWTNYEDQCEMKGRKYANLLFCSWSI